MRGCPICSRINESGAICPHCRWRLRVADYLARDEAPPGTGCALAVILMLVFWVTLAVVLLVLL